MRKHAAHLILGGLATISVGIGTVATASAVAASGAPEASLTNAQRAAGDVVVLPSAAATAKAPAVSKAAPVAKAAAPVAKAAAPVAKAAAPAPKKPAAPTALLSGTTKGSYFWDTGSSGNGDTGAPASGLPMQEGCFASPSWPMGTKGYVLYNGKRANFFICDRGPGSPSHSGVMLDIDGITYAKLTGGTWSTPEVLGGNGQAGHITVKWYVTKWGSGSGSKGMPQPL